jgi:hypothetical protein
MRAICGAIITAGALVGLGLTAIGYGLRYQAFQDINPETKYLYGAPSLMIILVTLVVVVLVGLGIAFLGLAFHHHRRYVELLRHSESSAHPNVAA